MNNFKILTFPAFQDSRGILTPIEFDDTLPFVPKRIYYAYETKDTRGGHAHMQEQEVFICLNGTCQAHIDPDKKGKQSVVLDAPTKGLYCGQHCWHEFDSFSEGAFLLCISSTHYFPGAENYIMNYEEFLLLGPSTDSQK